DPTAFLQQVIGGGGFVHNLSAETAHFIHQTDVRKALLEHIGPVQGHQLAELFPVGTDGGDLIAHTTGAAQLFGAGHGVGEFLHADINTALVFTVGIETGKHIKVGYRVGG